MKKYGYFLFVLYSLLLTHCTVDESTILLRNENQVIRPRTCNSFSSNEIASVGSMHNSFLPLIEAEFNCLESGQEADAIAALETFGENEEIPSGVIENAIDAMYEDFDIGDYAGDFDDYTTVADLYNEIILAIENNDDYDDLSDALDDVMTDANLSLTCFDFTFVGVAASVVRQSGYYWTHIEFDGLGNEPICGVPENRGGGAFWKKLILHDVEGATISIMLFGVGLAVPGANAAIATEIAAHAAWHSAIGAYLDLL